MDTKKHGPRNTRLNLRFTPAERAIIEARAAAESRNVSDWCRLALLALARRKRRAA